MMSQDTTTSPTQSVLAKSGSYNSLEMSWSTLLGLDQRVIKLNWTVLKIYTYILVDMTPAPSVGFNLTYVCPEGQVFNHDWFATPFVMMTCQVDV